MVNQLEPKLIALGWYSKKELLKNSVCDVLLPLSFDSFGHPVPDGLYDLRMGVLEKNQQCATCNLFDLSCPGHIGHIKLSAPVINPLMFNPLLGLLKSMCFKCQSFKITDFERMSIYIKLKALKRNIVLEDCESFVRNKSLEELENSLYTLGGRDSPLHELQYKTVDEFFKKYSKKTKCPRCNTKSPKISKSLNMRVLLQGKKPGSTIGLNKQKIVSYDFNSTNNEYFTPKEMMDLIIQLYSNESTLLSEFFNGGDYEMFFIEVLPVIPNRFRPARYVNQGVYENPVNTQLARIMQVSTALEADAKYWPDLQENIFFYFDGSKSNTNITVGCKQVLERKEGLFRSNIMGKRVNFSARSVISPDPNLHTSEIGIPMVFAKALTFPEKVTAFNVEKLRETVINGTNYPGCNFVECNGVLTNMAHISDGMRLAIARQLSSGKKVVWRHMVDGDYVLVNRQPTLHSAGLMGHKVKVLRSGSTIRIHYVNCKAYNADFDGDEMNIHFPQSFPAMAECKMLAHNDNNYFVQATGNPIRGLEQDHVVGAAKLTFKDSFFTKDEYFHLVQSGLGLNKWRGRVYTVKPCIMSPIPLYSGKQVVSSVLRTMKIETNYCVKTKLVFNKNNSCKDFSVKNFDTSQENYFYVRNGIIISGVLDKSTIGAASLSFVHACGEIYGYKICNDILAAVSGIVNGYLAYKGFTVRFDDLLMDNDYNEKRQKIFSKSNTEAIRMQSTDPTLFKNDYFYFDDDELRYLDNKMRQFLNNSISECVNLLEMGLFKKFPRNNMANIIMSGAKGSMVNLSQITCALGQQELESKRVPFMESGKTLPCYDRLEKCPAAGGNVYERFLTGLNPATFFFYCMAGREGLIDTAVKTANSGYLQRSLIKHLEGVKIEYDESVRNSGKIIQYKYGEDGLDCIKTSYIEKDEFYKTNIHLFKNIGLPVDSRGLMNDSLFKNIKREISKVDPGKSVGIIASQSIGEPSTQMTLNTFHLAGVGSKNVTLGIPRLQEILMVASKSIKTPVIVGKIKTGEMEFSREDLVGVFKRYTLIECLSKIQVNEEIIKKNVEYFKKIEIVFTIKEMEDLCAKSIDANFFSLLRKEIRKRSSSVGITEYSQKKKNLTTAPGEQDEKSSSESNDEDKILPIEETPKNIDVEKPFFADEEDECTDEETEDELFENLKKIGNHIYSFEILFPSDFNVFLIPLIENVAEKLVVREIPGFTKATVENDKIIMEGSDFMSLNNKYFGIDLKNAIDWAETYSNDIYSVYCVFGIEAARKCIVQEIKNVFDAYGIYINVRHLYLIADYMTKNGDFSPFNRGTFTMDDSFIQKMSFESCFANLKNSATFQQQEVVTNPSSCILLGSSIKQGTGSFDLLYSMGSNVNE